MICSKTNYCILPERAHEPVEEAVVRDQQHHVHVLPEQAGQLEMRLVVQEDRGGQRNAPGHDSKKDLAEEVRSCIEGIQKKHHFSQVFLRRHS